MSTENTVQAWCDAVDACVTDMLSAAEANDWERAGALCNRLDQTLRQSPPADAASAWLSRIRGSSGRKPSRPPRIATWVPWPSPVIAKLPWSPMTAVSGGPPTIAWTT